MHFPSGTRCSYIYVYDVLLQPFIAIVASPHDSITVTLAGAMVRPMRAMIG